MDKSRDLFPSHQPQGHEYEYDNPQATPSHNYNQANPEQPGQPPLPAGQPQYPPPGQQQTNFGPPPGQQQTQFGPPPQQQYPNVVIQQPMFVNTVISPPPPDHMTAAIFATLCCFCPIGVVAIIKANAARDAWLRGNTALAHTYAQTAKIMAIIAIVVGICGLITLAVFIAFLFLL